MLIPQRSVFIAIGALLAASLACASVGGPTGGSTDTPPDLTDRPIQEATADTPTAAPQGDVLYEDDFETDKERWTIGEETASVVSIRDGVMDIEILESQYMGWSHLYDDTFGNVRVEFDVEPQPDDPNGAWGVVCNYADSQNFYYMSFGSDGYYAIARYLDDEYLVLSDGDGNYVESALIEKGKASYHVEATCANGSLELKVDGKRVGSVDDDALTGGTVGLMVETFEGSHAQAYFDNLFVYPAD